MFNISDYQYWQHWGDLIQYNKHMRYFHCHIDNMQVIVIDILTYQWHICIIQLISLCYLTKLHITSDAHWKFHWNLFMWMPYSCLTVDICIFGIAFDYWCYLIIVRLINLTINIYWIITMAMNALPWMCMDWNVLARAQTFKLFRQISRMWFKVKVVEVEDQHNYITLGSGSIDLWMFNRWTI